MSAFILLRPWITSRFSEPDGDRGASLIEYALLLALIAMVVITAVTALGETTSTSFSDAASRLG
jgi:pilus assembly protein Flp/PilA